MKKQNKKTLWKVFLVSITAVAAVFFWQINTGEKAFLSRYNLEGKDLKTMVATLENDTNESSGFQAIINAHELLLSDATRRMSFPLPEDEFYVSIAPYIHQTHPCSTHNLVTCRGELKNEDFVLTIVNNHNQEMIIHQQMVHSLNNGFIGVWLPRNIEVTITISQGLLSATSTLTTYDTDNTCLTTLQLKE